MVAASVPSPMADLPVGATFGSLVHAVLEHADPARPDFRAELLRHIDEQLVWWPVDLDPQALADALVAVCDSPLGPLADDRTLLDPWACPTGCASSTSRSRCPGATTRPTPSTTYGWATSPRCCAVTCPTGDAVRIYADALDRDPDLAAQPLLGYLTGSIDVVLRLDVDGAERFLTVDYKTNWLGTSTRR